MKHYGAPTSSDGLVRVQEVLEAVATGVHVIDLSAEVPGTFTPDLSDIDPAGETVEFVLPEGGPSTVDVSDSLRMPDPEGRGVLVVAGSGGEGFEHVLETVSGTVTAAPHAGVPAVAVMVPTTSGWETRDVALDVAFAGINVALNSITEDLAAVATSGSADDLTVTPDGEMSATDVQAALVDLYDRTALDRALDDAYAAVTIVEQFPDIGGASVGRHGVHGWNVQVNGTGADVLQLTVTPAPAFAAFVGGGRFLVTGTTTSGRAALTLQPLVPVSSAAVPPPFWMEWYAGIPVLADGTDSFRAVFGVLGSATAAPSGPGVWFEHVNGQANWGLRAGGEGIDTGVPVVAEQMHRFRLVSDGGGTIYGYIDGTEVGQLAQADLSSTVAGQPVMGVFKTAGTANRWLAVQRYLARIEVAPQMVW